MRRARIRLQIAKAISTVLPPGHALTYPNVLRYVSRDVLTSFNIRRDTPIHLADWLIAIKVVREERIARTPRKSRDLSRLPLEDRIDKGLLKFINSLR